MSNGSASPFAISITMSSDTVTQLLQNGYQLFGFKGVDGPVSPQAAPLVWFTTSAFSALTTVSWTEQYGGYTSTNTNIAANTVMNASFSANMALGQQMNVGAGGIGSVVNTGTPGLLDILNQTTTPFTCGVTVFNVTTNISSPICAFPLFGGGLDNFAPIEIIYLMFATNAVNTGTVIEQSFAPGISIDMTGVTTTAPLTFDINEGWTGPGYSTNYPASTSLLPLLINPGGSAAMSVRAADRRKRALQLKR